MACALRHSHYHEIQRYLYFICLTCPRHGHVHIACFKTTWRFPAWHLLTLDISGSCMCGLCGWTRLCQRRNLARRLRGVLWMKTVCSRHVRQRIKIVDKPFVLVWWKLRSFTTRFLKSSNHSDISARSATQEVPPVSVRRKKIDEPRWQPGHGLNESSEAEYIETWCVEQEISGLELHVIKNMLNLRWSDNRWYWSTVHLLSIAEYCQMRYSN